MFFTGEINRKTVKTEAVQLQRSVTPPSKSPSLPLIQYKTYLQSCYKKDPIARDDKLGIAPSTEFINLALVGHDESTYTSFSGSTEGVSGESLGLDSIVTPDSRFVLVEGDAGMGKSTLCWELCRKWDDLESLQHYKIVVLQKLREMRLQKATTLNEIFHHDNPALSKGVVDEMYRCEGEGVLLILDGFDEMPAKLICGDESLIMRVICGACLPKATRLVTSRPSAIQCKEHVFPQEYRHIKTLGFADESIKQFAEKAFARNSEVHEHFKKFILSNPIIKSMMYIPVNCAILAQVYKDIMKSSKLMPKTMTQLYTTLVLVLIRRHMIERRKWDKSFRVPVDLKDLPNEIMASLKGVSKLAYRGLFKKQLVFSDDEVGDSFEHLGLLNEAKEMYVSEGARTSYAFSHLSIQEFLAAFCVSCYPEDLVDPLVFRHNYDIFGSSSCNICKFLCGLMKCSASYPEVKLWKWIFGTFGINKCGDYGSLLCSWLYEAQDFENFLSLTRECEQSEDYSLAITIQSPLVMYAFGYSLAKLPIDYFQVKIRTSLDTLQSSLADHASHHLSGSIISLTVDTWMYSEEEIEQLASLFTNYSGLVMGVSIKIKDIDQPLFTRFIPALCDTKSMSLWFFGICEEDYLIYQSMKNFTELEELYIHCSGCTRKGAEELSKVISSSPLKELTLNYSALHHYPMITVDPFASYSVVNAALNSPTLETLNTNFAFQFFKIRNIQKITICIAHDSGNLNLPNTTCQGNELLRILASLWYCFYRSDQRTLPLELVELKVFAHTNSSQVMVYNFVATVNEMLHRISQLGRKPHLSLYLQHYCASRIPFINDPMYCVLPRRREQQLDHMLRSSLTSCNLKKWQSLVDLRPLPKHHLEIRPLYEVRKKQLKGISWSCPDLLELQAIHDIHPEMFGALECGSLYYRSDLYYNNYYRKKRKERKFYHARANQPEIDIDEISSSECSSLDEVSDSDDELVMIDREKLHFKIVHSQSFLSPDLC